ncbi:MAG: hypothetical protein PHO48_04545 [Candidatus Gracilibacteria bacterium]|nr:hypothetical protein [Candidatus Gracilibacteria bacterium]
MQDSITLLKPSKQVYEEVIHLAEETQTSQKVRQPWAGILGLLCVAALILCALVIAYLWYGFQLYQQANLTNCNWQTIVFGFCYVVVPTIAVAFIINFILKDKRKKEEEAREDAFYGPNPGSQTPK